MSILDEPVVVSVLKEIAGALSLSEDDVELAIDKGADKGDGYLSQMSLVRMSSKSKSVPETDLVVKCAQRDPSQRATFPTHELYLRETRFYEEILPAINKFERANGVRQVFSAVPKFYASRNDRDKEFLIMENVKKRGFELMERKTLLGEEHVKLILNHYAQLHAASFAMQRKDAALYERLSSRLDNLFVPKYVHRSFFESFELAMDKAIGLFRTRDPEDGKYHERLSQFREAGKMWEFFDLITQTDWEHPVICHGDSWLNNFMFKYSKKDGVKRPEEVKIIDFQMTRHVSTILDVGYLIYMNTDAAIYNNYEKYLQFYFELLVKHGNSLGVDIDRDITYDVLKAEWAKYGVYGLLFGLIGVGMLLQEKDDVIDLSDIANGEISAANVFFIDNNSELAIGRMRSLVKHFVDNGFI